LTVLGTNSADGLAFDNGGPTFIVNGNLLDADTLSLMVNGSVDLANGSFTANAAGINHWTGSHQHRKPSR
jgi:hypothetical protein